MAERKPGHQSPKTVSTVAGEDWYGKVLSGETHERVLFQDIDLTEASLSGMVFSECTFRRVQFNCSTHQDGAFVNCTFANCSFFETKVTPRFLSSWYISAKSRRFLEIRSIFQTRRCVYVPVRS